MIAARLPEDETLRLAELAAMNIMDTDADAKLDSFVRLAADLYDMPIALVSLLDERRQWFKASHGLDITETPRDYAFCSHTILMPDEVMVIEDALADPRFADSPLVLGEPNIRFYAGAAIRSPLGQPVGALCVIDHSPRTIDDDGRRRLQTLADGVSALLHLHSTASQLRRAATHDKLTGLANRALFDHRLDLAVADALLGRPCALVLLDLDQFKRVNDRLGHMAGDEVLCRVADRLAGVSRGGDLVARFGGDEFAILMNDPVDEDAVAALVGRIAAIFVDPFAPEGQFVWMQSSVGVAQCPIDAHTAGTLLRAADRALYHAKNTGGGCAVMAGDPRLDLTSHLTPGQALKADLLAALDAGTLSIHWQPYRHTTSGELAGFEALTRWHRPGHGEVEPNVFIPFAETAGLIAKLDSWVLETACLAAASWDQKLAVSVNLSAYWFGGGGVVALVRRCLARSRLAPNRLCVEITERTPITDRAVARQQIDVLQSLGVRVALDDFGTGFSSLGYLRDMPFDTLKLDRSFVSALGHDARADQVAAAILDLGHLLGMTVCAEGVETAAQLDQLRSAGCDQVQGYLLGTPAAVPDFSPARAMMPVVDWPATSSASTTLPPAASTRSAPTTVSTV